MNPALEPQRLTVRLTRLVTRDDLLSELARVANRCDASLWLVGGIVRDAAMGRPTGDVDLVAGPGCARLVREIRRHWRTRGFRFRRRGVTTWRFKLGSRTVDVVDAARRGVEADLLRRDVTINAIAFDLTGRRILDPLHGLRDLERGRLRATRDAAFAEDPLRVLRVCRFLSVFPDLTLEASSARSARAVAPRLKRSPPERVLPELDKLLLGSEPVRGLRTAERLGARAAVLPELTPLADCVAGRERPDVWTHTLDALELAAGPRRLPGTARVGTDEDRLVLRWAVLLHDVAKPETLEFAADGRPTFHGHEAIGRQLADDLMRRLRFPVVRRARIARLVLNHLRPGHLADSGASTRALNRLLREMDDDLPLLVAHAACDARASGGPDSPARWRRLRVVLRSLLEHYDRQPDEPAEPLIDGRDVMRVTGLAPGPPVGRLLDRVRRQQRAGRIRTRREALAFLRRAGRPAARTPDLTDRAGREDP